MATSRGSRRPPPPPPISAPLAAAASRIAVAQICQSVGYHAAEPSALRALADVSACYLLALARAAASAANARGRTDANLLDVVLALEQLTLLRGFPGAAEPGGRLLRSSAGPLRGLMDFVATVDEVPFARPLRRGRASGASPGPRLSFSQMGRDPPFPHVPRWLPAFPDAWEGGQGRRGDRKGMEKGKELVGWGGSGELLRAPSDGNQMVEKGGERRPVPMERARVRFRLRPVVVERTGGEGEEGSKKRKMELSSVVSKAPWKETRNSWYFRRGFPGKKIAASYIASLRVIFSQSEWRLKRARMVHCDTNKQVSFTRNPFDGSRSSPNGMNHG